jgi:plasmid maintenance system antidote protein VapI
MAAAARRIPLERPPNASDEAKVLRQQKLLRARVGENLKRIRTEAGLSLRALGMRADISTNHLSRCEKGLHGVTIDLLVRVSYFLDTTPTELLAE